jgi:hypothetical protein
MSDPLGPAPVSGEPTPTAPRRPRSALLDPARLPGAATALGVALVSGAVVLASVHARGGGDLDTSNFTMGVLATLGLLGLAVVAHLLVPAAETSAQLTSWPGAAGALGAGAMLAVLINDDDWSPYVAALVVLGLSVGGYLLTRSAPFVLSTIAGLALLYAKAFDDVFDLNGGGDNTFMAIGAGVLVFVVAVTILGWLLPATRVLSGVVIGAGGLGAMVVILVALAAFRAFTAVLSTPRLSFDDSAGTAYSSELTLSRPDPLHNDVWMVLLYCALLAVLWAAAALATGHVGFRVLLVADGVLVIPLAAAALLAAHPTWWEVVCAALGGLVLLGALAGAWVRRPSSTPPVAPPASGP